MKLHAKFLFAATIAMTICSTNIMAMGRFPHSQQDKPLSSSEPAKHYEGGRGGHGKSVPEIDAASGTSAIALLVGALALMKERGRSRKTPKEDV